MYSYELACLAENYGTTFECGIEDAEVVIVYVQNASDKSNGHSFKSLSKLYELTSRHGKTVHVVEFGAYDSQPATCCLPDLLAAVEVVISKYELALAET